MVPSPSIPPPLPNTARTLAHRNSASAAEPSPSLAATSAKEMRAYAMASERSPVLMTLVSRRCASVRVRSRPNAPSAWAATTARKAGRSPTRTARVRSRYGPSAARMSGAANVARSGTAPVSSCAISANLVAVSRKPSALGGALRTACVSDASASE